MSSEMIPSAVKRSGRGSPWIPALAVGAVLAVAAGLGLRLLSTSGSTLAAVGGVRLTYEVEVPRGSAADPIVADVARTMERRIGRAVASSRVRVDGHRIEVDLPNVGGSRSPPGQPSEDEIERILTRSGRLEFKFVDGSSDYMGRVARWLPSVRTQLPDVAITTESWRSTTGEMKALTSLTAPLRASLEAVISSLPPELAVPADHQIALEHAARYDADGNPLEPTWRTLYLHARAEIDNDGIAEAEVLVDPGTLRPELSVTLVPKSAAHFAEVTAAHVGDKLAILLEGKVNSAPVIDARIAGGKVRITLGSSTGDKARADALDLVAVLRADSLAAPVKRVARVVVERPGDPKPAH